MPGGTNLKAVAISKLKRDLTFRLNFEGKPVPATNFEDWCAAMHSLLSIRIVGVSTLRFATKQITTARSYWKLPSKQESLNVIADRLMLAEKRCADRASERKEKRLLRDIVSTLSTSNPKWQEGDPGRPPMDADRSKKSEPLSPQPATDLMKLWQSGIDKFETEKKEKQDREQLQPQPQP